MKILIVTNMLPSPQNPKAGTFIEQQIRSLEALGLDIHVVLVDRANKGMQFYARTGRLVSEGIEISRPDLVHVMYGGLLADLALEKRSRRAQVVSFCGVDLLGADYGALKYRIRTWLGRRASFRAAAKADAIIVKSQNLKDGLPQNIDRSIVSIIPNGISLERFRPLDQTACRDRLGWAPGRFHVLFSTNDRNDRKKRLPLAEEAVEVLNRRGLQGEIHGLSKVPHDEVGLWLSAADAVLMTSRSDEGSPNIIKEALACNRPVVSVDVGDVAERIDGIEGCYLAEPDPESLAQALTRVYEGPRVVEAREKMRELSLERIAGRIAEVYDRALERRNRGV